MAAPVLRPRSTPEIVDAAFQLARGHFMPLLVVSVIVAIPSLILGAVNAWLLPTPTAEEPFGSEWMLSMPLSLIAMCWTFIGYGAVTVAAADAYLGSPVDSGGSLKRAFGRAGPLIFGNLIAYVIMMFPFIVAGILAAAIMPQLGEGDASPSGTALLGLLLMVVLFLFGIYWVIVTLAKVTLVTPVAALERVGPLDSWRRAKLLAEGSKKRILLLVLVASVVILGIVFGGFALIRMVISNENLASALSSVVAIPLWPVLGSLFVVLYYDMRIRKEAFDLEVMTQGLGGGTAEAGARPA